MGREGPAYISIPVQQDAIQRWANFRGIEIVEWQVDEDESGGTQHRPGLRRAMERVKAGETDGIACWRLNRFARNVREALGDIKAIEAAGAHLALVEEQIDPTGPFGRFLLTVLLAVATLERDNAVAGFATAKKLAVARGAYVSRTPWGYRRIRAGERKGVIEPDPITGPMVTEAFQLAAGEGLAKALAYLMEAWPERSWTMPKVRRMLRMRAYLGETRNGDLVALDTHEPLTTKAIWEMAQSDPEQRRVKATFPLSGFPTCGTCGTHMVGARGGVHGQRMYRCADALQRSRPATCAAPVVITAQALEEHVQQKAIEQLAKFRVTIGDAAEETLATLERALDEAEWELDQFAADQTARRALKDRYHQHLEARERTADEAREAYRAHARSMGSRRTLTTGGLTNLDDPEMFLAGVRSLFKTARVIRRRGQGPIEGRVALVPLEGDGTTGEAGAEDGQIGVLDAPALSAAEH